MRHKRIFNYCLIASGIMICTAVLVQRNVAQIQVPTVTGRCITCPDRPAKDWEETPAERRREKEERERERERQHQQFVQRQIELEKLRENKIVKNMLSGLQRDIARVPLATGPPTRRARIGAAAAVRGEVFWITSDGRKVPIQSGSPIFFGERIITGDSGHLQLLLLDETVFTMGPSSDMVLDEFVYDPITTAGKVIASIVKGSFRFITGKAAHKEPDQLKVKLPVGDLGYRGTDCEFFVAADRSGFIKLYSGQIDLTPTINGAMFLMNAGETVTFTSNGEFGQPAKLLYHAK